MRFFQLFSLFGLIHFYVGSFILIKFSIFLQFPFAHFIKNLYFQPRFLNNYLKVTNYGH
jgi:hypothetical protein